MGFETIEDLEIENLVMDRLVNICNWHPLVKLGEFFPVDFVEVGGDGISILSMGDIKGREFKYDNEILHISLRKWTDLANLSKYGGIPARIVVYFKKEKECYSIDVSLLENPKLIYGGRKGRGASNDREPMFEIPISSMKFLWKEKEDGTFIMSLS